MSYATNHVKRNAETGEVAIRTVFDESEPALAAMAWLVATAHAGAKHAKTDEVDSWDDLYTPPAAE